jgi:Phytanoyl-CoA dioxygenase (PhyH)
MRDIFRAPKHNRAFNRDGYLMLEAFDQATIRQMDDFFMVSTDQDFTGWHNSLELDSPEQKARIYEFLKNVFDEHGSKYLDNYRAIAGTFISKKSDADSVVHLHPDWAFVNEAAYTSLNLWIPLCETDANNGALTVLKGSHKIKQNVRGMGIPSGFKFSRDVAAKYLTLIPMKPGWILFYDSRLLHASGVNRSGRPRTVASVSLIPSEATPLHYLGTEDGVIELEVDASFYHHYHLGAARDVDRGRGYRATEAGSLSTPQSALTSRIYFGFTSRG